ncbi:MAG TPA: ATP-binding protein, partial [Anaerolineae bacterium]|nr:ATP-binding protein [Anaerolineae bacterium]
MSQEHVRTIPGRYEEIQNICAFMVQGAKEAGLDESALFHVELACDEACTNIIEHAYGDEGQGDIVASWQIDGNDFIMMLHDDGR